MHVVLGGDVLAIRGARQGLPGAGNTPDVAERLSDDFGLVWHVAENGHRQLRPDEWQRQCCALLGNCRAFPLVLLAGIALRFPWTLLV